MRNQAILLLLALLLAPLACSAAAPVLVTDPAVVATVKGYKQVDRPGWPVFYAFEAGDHTSSLFSIGLMYGGMFQNGERVKGIDLFWNAAKDLRIEDGEGSRPCRIIGPGWTLETLDHPQLIFGNGDIAVLRFYKSHFMARHFWWWTLGAPKPPLDIYHHYWVIRKSDGKLLGAYPSKRYGIPWVVLGEAVGTKVLFLSSTDDKVYLVSP